MLTHWPEEDGCERQSGDIDAVVESRMQAGQRKLSPEMGFLRSKPCTN